MLFRLRKKGVEAGISDWTGIRPQQRGDVGKGIEDAEVFDGIQERSNEKPCRKIQDFLQTF